VTICAIDGREGRQQPARLEPERDHGGDERDDDHRELARPHRLAGSRAGRRWRSYDVVAPRRRRGDQQPADGRHHRRERAGRDDRQPAGAGPQPAEHEQGVLRDAQDPVDGQRRPATARPPRRR
jgi:hypothetical protein